MLRLSLSVSPERSRRTDHCTINLLTKARDEHILCENQLFMRVNGLAPPPSETSTPPAIFLADSPCPPTCPPSFRRKSRRFFGGTQAGPRGGATFAIRQALDNAKSEVLVQAYSFTSAPIAEALVRAHKRGVKVQVLLDKSQQTEKYSSADFLANAGIPTMIDAAHAIAHNKVMIIDNEIVITGSFNFTKAAEERNAENLLVIHDKELASRYIENWQLHEQHSEQYFFRTKKMKAK